MSNNIILTRYTEAENGKFSENESKNIDSTVLPETIFEGIDESYFKLVEIQEEDSEKIYEQKIINESKINELLDYLRIIVKKEINKTLDDKLTIEAEDVILNNLRLLLNVRNIVLVKVEKFNDDKNLMLVVG